MSDISTSLLSIVFAAFVLGVIALVGMALLYLLSYPGNRGDEVSQMSNVLDWMDRRYGHPAMTGVVYSQWLSRVATVLHDVAVEAMAKREMFWSLLVQSAISVIVIVFIAILLLLKIVSAEAGLPILAAFGGAAISRGFESGRSALRPRTEAPPPPPQPEG